MKNNLLACLIAIVYVCTLPACNSDKQLAERVMKAIKDGELHFTQTPSGKELIIIPNDIPSSFSMANHLVAENGGKGNFLENLNALHNIPKGLESYEFVKEWSDSTLICDIKDISKEAFEKDTIMKYYERFKTYDEFKKSMVSMRKESIKFELLDNETKIKYCTKVYQKRFYYKCKTVSGYKRVQVCFLNEFGKMKLFAIFSEDI